MKGVFFCSVFFLLHLGPLRPNVNFIWHWLVGWVFETCFGQIYVALFLEDKQILGLMYVNKTKLSMQCFVHSEFSVNKSTAQHVENQEVDFKLVYLSNLSVKRPPQL